MQTPTISLCMITKNEEKYLEECLNSVKSIVDEIIIVDTGSTDKTKDIAKKFNVKIFDFKWSDDFSEARNESLKHATKDWILVLDADEILDDDGLKSIKNLVNEKDYDGFLFLQKNYSNETSITGFTSEEHEKHGNKCQGWYSSFIVRLFRNKKSYKFEGAVHELVEHSIENAKGKIAVSNISIHHYGNADPEIARKKRKIYLELCLKKIKQNPSASSYYELGILQKENNEIDKAIESLKKAAELNNNNHLALYELGVIYEQQKKFDDAIKYYMDSLSIRASSEAFLNIGVCYLKKGMLKESYESFTKAMLISPNNHTIYNNLGAVLEKLGNFDSAAQMLEIATKLNRSNTIGFYNLGIVLDKKGDFVNALKNYDQAVKLGHKNKEQIQKRIAELKKIIAKDPNYNYSFKMGE